MSHFRQSAIFCSRLLQATLTNTLPARKMKRWVAPTLHELYKRREAIGPEPIKPRSSFLEWNYDAEVYAFGKRIGEAFDRDLLQQALLFKSHLNVAEEAAKRADQPFEQRADNRRLVETGGDLIRNYLNVEFRKLYENGDFVDAIVAYLNNEKMLAFVANNIGLTDIVLTSEFPVDESTLSDTFKAIVAALAESQSDERAHLFINDFLIVQLNGKDIFDIWSPTEPYNYFEKLINCPIEARLCNKSAINTILAVYQVGIYDGNKKMLGIGWGESVEIAKNTAALDGIRRFYRIK